MLGTEDVEGELQSYGPCDGSLSQLSERDAGVGTVDSGIEGAAEAVGFDNDDAAKLGQGDFTEVKMATELERVQSAGAEKHLKRTEKQAGRGNERECTSRCARRSQSGLAGECTTRDYGRPF